VIDIFLMILALGLAFLLGSLPFSYWVVKAKCGADLRDSGSGNIGATNVFRTQGKALGSLALALDALKGLAAVILIPVLFSSPYFLDSFSYQILLGILAIAGHTFTPFLNWKGGKGVATSAGVFLGILPLAFFIALGLFLIVFLITRIISVSSLTAAFFFPIIIAITELGMPHFLEAVIIGIALALFIFYTHRSNIKRLIKGEEHRMGKKK